MVSVDGETGDMLQDQRTLVFPGVGNVPTTTYADYRLLRVRLETSPTWSFGDGTTGSGEFVSHTYLDGGDLSIELRVTDTRGRTASHVESIHLNRRPVASLTVSCKSSTCVFDATASYDPDGSIYGVEWRFGDGTGSGCGGGYCPLTTSHTYAAPGTYTATVEITDGFHLAARVSRTVTVRAGRRSQFIDHDAAGDLVVGLRQNHGAHGDPFAGQRLR